MNKNRITLFNIISNVILQICTIISGFIIPKIILKYFGSEVNGLVASLNQFLNYITLLEGGITGVITANLYKPLVEKNNKRLSSIIKTANSFYKKIGVIFITYSISVAIIYPIVFRTSFSFIYVFSLAIILALNLFIQYMFSLTLKALLNADKKIYVVAFTQTGIVILNIILAILSIKIYPNIHLLKLISGGLYIIQPIVFGKYVKSKYNFDKECEIDEKLLKERWNGFAINLAAFIHNSTDVTILTMFTNLEMVSVYSVYALVTSGLKQLIISITSGINPVIGHAYAKGDLKELNEKMDIYEFIVNILVFLSFSVASLLITPFVLLYTRDIDNGSYNQYIFGILLIISEAIYLLKFPHLNLAYSANKFKEITKSAYIEAIINIVISLIFVFKFGIVGVAIGTVVAMIYRLIFHVKYTKNIINTRNQWIFYRKIILFIIATFIGMVISYFVPSVELNIFNWLLHAIIYVIIFIAIYSALSLLFFKNEINYLKRYLLKNKGVN